MNRKFFILWSVSLVLIFSAILYKISKLDLEKKTEEPAFTEDEILEMSDSFYLEEEKLSTTTKTTQNTQPTISARAYLIGNINTGEIYKKYNENAVLPVASMSKLITAVESIDQLSLSYKVTVNGTTTVPDSYKIRTGDIFTVEELLYPLLLNSSNSVAEILASTTDRIKFMELMSSYAWEIGMPATFFADPTGLSPLNKSSAKDFFELAKYLYRLRPEILAITKNKNYSLATTSERGGYIFTNTHPFAGEENFIGGKTGHTPSAKDTMLTIMKIKEKPIAFIVLSSDDRRRDTLYLINEVKKILP